MSPLFGFKYKKQILEKRLSNVRSLLDLAYEWPQALAEGSGGADLTGAKVTAQQVAQAESLADAQLP